MRTLINKILDYIGKSVHSKKDGKISSTRIASYFILGGILTTIALFIGIEWINAVVIWKSGLSYIVPNEHIVLFGIFGSAFSKSAEGFKGTSRRSAMSLDKVKT